MDKLLACGFLAASDEASRQWPRSDGAPWEIWAAGPPHAGGSSSPGHSAAAVPVGLLGPPVHNMGPCSRAALRPGEDLNAWKQFGLTWATALCPNG